MALLLFKILLLCVYVHVCVWVQKQCACATPPVCGSGAKCWELVLIFYLAEIFCVPVPRHWDSLRASLSPSDLLEMCRTTPNCSWVLSIQVQPIRLGKLALLPSESAPWPNVLLLDDCYLETSLTEYASPRHMHRGGRRHNCTPWWRLDTVFSRGCTFLLTVCEGFIFTLSSAAFFLKKALIWGCAAHL